MLFPQVFPHVLLVCQPGLRSADPAADAKLETTLQILSLVSYEGLSLASVSPQHALCAGLPS